MDDARAILVADQMDAEEEDKAEARAIKAAEDADLEAAAREELRSEARTEPIHSQ
jgi:hypothetical protein